MDDLEGGASLFAGELRDFVSGEGRVISADRNQIAHAGIKQGLNGIAHGFGRGGGIGAGSVEDRAAAQMDSADVLNGQGQGLEFALYQMCVPIEDAEHFKSIIDGLDGHGMNDPIDAGSGTTADNDG